MKPSLYHLSYPAIFLKATSQRIFLLYLFVCISQAYFCKIQGDFILGPERLRMAGRSRPCEKTESGRLERD